MKEGTQPTHEVTQPNKKPPTQIEVFKHELNRDYNKQVTNYFNGSKDKAMKFMSAVVYSVQKTPALLECDKTSLFQAFMTCAEFELFPQAASGEAFIIPYKGKAQFQLGYQGIVTLLYRAGISSITTQIIHERDHFEYEEGLEPKLIHKPATFGERGKPIGVYAIGSINGEKVFKVMSEADVMRIKNLSKAKASEYSPWNSGQDPEKWMWRKTCIKQLAKVMPKNDALVRAVEKDNEDSVIQRNQLDAGGPAVGAALHVPTEEPKAEENQEETENGAEN